MHAGQRDGRAEGARGQGKQRDRGDHGTMTINRGAQGSLYSLKRRRKPAGTIHRLIACVSQNKFHAAKDSFCTKRLFLRNVPNCLIILALRLFQPIFLLLLF